MGCGLEVMNHLQEVVFAGREDNIFVSKTTLQVL